MADDETETRTEHADMVDAQRAASDEHKAEAARRAAFRRPQAPKGVDNPARA